MAATALEDGIVAKLNLIRRAHRLTPLRVNPGLTAAARLHSRDMVANGYFEHETLDGKPFWKRVERFYGAYPAPTSTSARTSSGRAAASTPTARPGNG